MDKPPHEQDTHLGDILKRHAALSPKRLAISSGATELSFGDLDTISTNFALSLRSSGTHTGEAVCVLASKSVPAIAAAFGILKAGGVFSPLDPSAPVDRIAYQLRLLLPKTIVVDRSAFTRLKAVLPKTAKICLIPSPDTAQFVMEETEAAKASHDLPDISPDAAAYCIFTSGSTGHPKGVRISHDSAMQFLLTTSEEAYPVREMSRCMNTAPLYFDVFMYDIILPLYRGASVELFCELPVPDRMVETLVKKRITHLVAISSMLTLIGKARNFDSANLSELKHISSGAEILNIQTVQQWLRKVPGLTVVNGYGPTEATCSCVSYHITQVEDGRINPYPIGRAHRGVRTLLISRNGRPVNKPGAVGELWVGGRQVMLGYWGNDAETNKRIKTIDGERFYRTGDRCAIDEFGDLVYVGRIDDELKISGYRIHPNEILRATQPLRFIKDCQVVVLDDSAGRHYLVAAVVAPGITTNRQQQSELSRAWRSKLPDYMRPRHFVPFEQFPQTPNGKTDVRALVGLVREAIAANKALLVAA